MTKVSNFLEPKELLLIHKKGNGQRKVVGRLTTENNWTLRYEKDLSEEDDTFYPFTKKKEHYKNVEDLLLKRIPSLKREDIDDFFEYYGLEKSIKEHISPFALLGYFGGEIGGDNFSFALSFEKKDITSETEISFKIAAIEYHHKKEFKVSDTLELRPEENNQHDENAIQIFNCKEEVVGYVPKGLNISLIHFLNDNTYTVECSISRVNGTDSKPKVLAICRIKKYPLSKEAFWIER